MKVVGITMVKDEADIIGATLAWMLGQVDHVIVADNLSTDGTAEILQGLRLLHGPDRLTIVTDDDPGYRQSAKMTKLAHLAGERGAEWIVPFDADEIWHTLDGTRLGDLLVWRTSEMNVVSATLYDRVATADDPDIPDNPLQRIQWRRREAVPMPKVAARFRHGMVIEQGNHGVWYPITPHTVLPGHVRVCHFPYRSPAQFVLKAKNGYAAYKAAPEIPLDVGAHWRGYGAIIHSQGDAAGEYIFKRWFWSADPGNDAGLVHEPCVAAFPS